MKIQELIILATNRLASLNNAKATAVALGNISAFDILDSDIAETENTLNYLRAITVIET